MADDAQPKPPLPFHKKLWREWIKPVGTVVIVFSTLRSVVADWNDVPSGSMEPTILIGDRIFVNKLAYGLRVPFTTKWMTRWNTPQRGDIVVCFSPEAEHVRLVKRCVAVAGDTVELRQNRIVINGKPANIGELDQDTITAFAGKYPHKYEYATEEVDGRVHPVMTQPGQYAPKRDYGPVTVPPGHYFMMGDNRDNSKDSRFWGFVPESQILGRSGRVLFSLNKDNYYIPRFTRFFHGLP
jgi:signal peptidase I